ncbi:MAG: ribose-5-phosphate isomerase B [Candidatus Methanolliviera sp. GoM_oil]|nr:MAG: ribose-5-phosphate isomerase B [Candidatus Methanolliviera sp. GoM_oil]
MTIYVGSDHAGFELKEKIREFLAEEGYEFEDLGPYRYNREDDYPDYALKVCKKVLTGDKGILICGTGQGMDMAANKIPGIRAAVCWNEITARNASKLNTNVLTMGGRMIESDAAKKIIKIWLEPTEIEERHARRIDKIKKIEKGI